MSMLQLRTLVLNASYTPISLFPDPHSILVEKSIRALVVGTCTMVESYRQIRTPKQTMFWPAVIVRKSNIRVQEKVGLKNWTLWYRDHGQCAYCTRPITINEMQWEHVHPRSKGGKTCWDNIVAACPSCNSQKGDALPTGKWRPTHEPYVPTYYQLLGERRKFPVTVDHESWIPYLGPWRGEIVIRDAAASILARAA